MSKKVFFKKVVGVPLKIVCKLKKFSAGPYVNIVKSSPDLKYYSYEDIVKSIEKYKRKNKGELKFLDVGGRYGEYRHLAKGFKYNILDIDKSIKDNKDVIIGDICNCPNIKDNSYDIVFSNNVFEHIKEPWAAAEESVRITKKGGLIITITPFSWRYHPVPVDTFRYSHYGLSYLYERTGKMKTTISGYDITNRRKDARGGYNKKGLDKPPIDHLGGWRENWETIYIGYKK